MEEKIKIYCVLFDTMSLCPEILSIAKAKKANFFLQVGGCFTLHSIAGMLTGILPSDLEEHGPGHVLDRKKCFDKRTNTICRSWKKKIILDVLLKNDWKIKYQNYKWMEGVFYYSPKIKSSTSHHTTTEKFKNLRGRKFLLTGKRSKIFQSNEMKTIKMFQKEKINKNTFYFIRYEHFHEATSFRQKPFLKKRMKTAKKISLKLMNAWDLNEPNALFWFFCDHGDWLGVKTIKHPNSTAFLSWVIFKDNTKNFIKPKSKFISNLDFTPTIMNKFDYDCQLKDSYSIEKEQDQNRIYFSEDARHKIDPNNSTTAIACKFFDWENKKPRKLLDVSYHEKNNSFKSHISIFDKEMFVKEIRPEENINKELKTALINKFNWIKK